MTDLEHGLRDTSWVADPRPLTQLESGVRRRRRRIGSILVVTTVVVSAAVLLVLVPSGGGDKPQVLLGPRDQISCPGTYFAPEPTAGALNDPLFPSDTTSLQVCVYEDSVADPRDTLPRLRGVLTVPTADTEKVVSGFEDLPTDVLEPFCLRAAVTNVLLLGTGDSGRTTVALTIPCGTVLNVGSRRIVGSTPELRELLGLDPALSISASGVAPGVGTTCPPQLPEQTSTDVLSEPLSVTPGNRIDVCSYGVQPQVEPPGPSRSSGAGVRDSRVLLGDQAAQISEDLTHLTPSAGSDKACLGPPAPGVTVVVSRADSSRSTLTLSLGCGSTPYLSDGRTMVRADANVLRALLIDPDDPSGPLL